MNSNPDFINHDAIIYVLANRRKGTYSTEVRLRNGRRVRTAGRLNASASAHSLLSIGLIAALRSISQQIIKKISRYRERKARLKIVSSDATFADALQALMVNDRAAKPFRAGRQFLSPLARQLARFDVELTTDTEDKNFALQSLRNWVQMNVDNHRKQLLPTFLVPVAVAESH